MSTTASLKSIERPLHLCGRPDLLANPIQFRGTRYWSVKDPISLRYYQLCDEELFILEQLDGQRGFEEIKGRFDSRFAPRKLDSDELYAFLGTLQREGLITSKVAGQGEPLLERHRLARRKEKLRSLTNLLAIRFRGLDPEPLLRVLYPNVRWMFTRAALLVSLMLVLGALFSVAIHAETFVSRLPRLQTFLSVENVMLMAAVLASCKVLHELGHALTCKHFGGQCHELGVMLLVFTPCLYCNVSDAWMMRNKWKRIAVSAAGIYVELVLASVCTILWWFSQPGILNAILLNVMFICSVGTILFNGNPLLRYDGYFILADLIELPNMRQQSQTLLQQFAARCFGIEPRESWTVQRRHTTQLVVYGVASLVYRWVLVAGILFAIYQALEPYRLESIAHLVAVLVIGGMIGAPLWQMVRVARHPRTGRTRGPWRSAVTGLGVAVAIVLLGMIPVSRNVTAPVIIEPANAARVHVTVPGTLNQIASVGQQVAEGDVVAKLTDVELDRQLAALQGERDIQELYTAQLQKLQVLERGASIGGAGSQIETAREALAAAERQLAQKRRDIARLTLTAPQSGTVMRDRPKRPAEVHEQLPTWNGSPLDERNRGCHLETDTIICLIGDPNHLKGVVLIDHTQIERVTVGQSVRMLVDELHEQPLTGSIVDIARVEVERVPPELIAKQLLPDETDESASVFYAASIELNDGQTAPLLWSSGKAKIAVKPLSLGEAVYKQLCGMFRIDL